MVMIDDYDDDYGHDFKPKKVYACSSC